MHGLAAMTSAIESSNRDSPVLKSIKNNPSSSGLSCHEPESIRFAYPTTARQWAIRAKFNPMPIGSTGDTAAIALFAYGTMIELIQHRLPYREFSVADLLANGAGICAYWLSIPLLRRIPRLRARWTQPGTV